VRSKLYKLEQGNCRLHFAYAVHSRRADEEMQPVVNMPYEYEATDVGSMPKRLVKIACVVPEVSSHTGRQTYVLITILRNHSYE